MKRTLFIDPGTVLSRLQGRPFGINVNYLRDHDANRPGARPLLEALREMNPGHLRYPGGEKSDWVLFDRGQPRPFGPYKAYAENHTLMSLDGFVALARGCGARPHVVVGYDSPARTGVSEDAYLDNALGLVRYANSEKGYGIEYWEIGNENWHNGTASPEEMARVVSRFSREMKKADPLIKICASGVKEDWWRRFLPLAGEDVDCLVVSQYSCMDWGGYGHFPGHSGIDLVGNAREAAACLRRYLPGRADRIRVVLAELNSKDYADLFGRPHWADSNDLGHSLVTFGILCQMLEMPEAAYGMVWNTRWMDQEEEHARIWYGLDRDNRLLPSAMPLKILGMFLGNEMVACEAPDACLAFASKSADGSRLAAFVIAKDEQAEMKASLSVRGGGYRLAERYEYSGQGAGDLSPALQQRETGGADALGFPPVSLTTLIFEREPS